MISDVALRGLVRWASIGCGLKGVEQAEAVVDAVLREEDRSTVIIYFWVADALSLLVTVRNAQSPLLTESVSVCGASALGRATGRFLSSFGRRTLPLRFVRGCAVLRDVKAIIRERSPLFMTVDGDGPYGRIHPSLAKLVEARRSIAIPLAALSSRALSLGRIGGFRVPLPRSTIALACGPPMLPTADGGQPVSGEQLANGLQLAEVLARSVLSRSGKDNQC